MLHTPPRAILPEACLALPENCQHFLVELIRFARRYAVHHKLESSALQEIGFHAPLWLVARALGVHRTTLWRWLRLPETRYVVAACPHKTQGTWTRINDGTLFSVRLFPDGERQASIWIDPGHQYRNLSHDAYQQHLQQSYSLEHEDLFSALWYWCVDKERFSPTASDCCEAAPDLVDKVHGLRLGTGSVEQVATNLASTLNDRAWFGLWCKLLHRLKKLPEAYWWRFTDQLSRALACAREGTRKPGLFLYLQTRGWLLKETHA